MDKVQSINIFFKKDFKTISEFFDGLQVIFNDKAVRTLDSIKSDFIDEALIREIKNLSNSLPIFFGKTLRDIKLTIKDDSNLKEHDIYLKYKGIKKLAVVAVNLPHSHLQDREYSSIEAVASAFKKYVSNLSEYFYELENIDRCCNVREPVNPTFKDDYRRIVIDTKTWLHIEVSPDGRPRNVHIVGNSEQGQDKVNSFLLKWDYDKNIVENIETLFATDKNFNSCETEIIGANNVEKETSCCICYCVELPGCLGLPQPLCQNKKCGAYYHRDCLFQWLLSFEGGRMPTLGVASGTCPTCLQPTTCNEKEYY